MERVLISQNENNNGTDYLVLNGTLVKDLDTIVEYGRLIAETDAWQEIYKNNFIDVRKLKNQILIKSQYIDQDIAGRSIYYIYLVKEYDSFEKILEYLRRDSELLGRKFDKEKTDQVILNLNNSVVKKKIVKYLILLAATSILIYYFNKN
ncbi:hypothetical protein [Flavobacterium ardleyense]|uniref:hypothetical protein n=1 Tax=Flavobacterium ardleyense TaxID=2038737 RepID=UPI00298C5EB3|nr:hypothetical protein [Flavobacterium ardleyense]